MLTATCSPRLRKSHCLGLGWTSPAEREMAARAIGQILPVGRRRLLAEASYEMKPEQTSVARVD